MKGNETKLYPDYEPTKDTPYLALGGPANGCLSSVLSRIDIARYWAFIVYACTESINNGGSAYMAYGKTLCHSDTWLLVMNLYIILTNLWKWNITWILMQSGPCFNVKTISPGMGILMMNIRWWWDPYMDKTAFLYWDGPLVNLQRRDANPRH